MDRTHRNPYAGIHSGGAGTAAETPGKRTLTEAFVPASRSVAVDSDADVEDKQDVPETEHLASVADKGNAQSAKPVPRLDLGKPNAGPKSGPAAGGDGTPGANAGAAPAAGGASGPNAKGAPAPGDPAVTAGIKIETAHTAAGNPNRSRTSVGVGEQVTFSAKGDGEWTAGGASIGSGPSASWTAPEAPGSVDITHTVKGSPAQKQTMKVVAPSSVEFKSLGGFPVAPAGVGMTTMVTVLPTTVSFAACEWQEVAGGPDGVKDYFGELVKSGKADLQHHPAKGWINMGESNNGVEDHAWTSDNPKLLNAADNTLRHWSGAFGWNIPNKYRVNQTGDGQVFTTVRQQFNMDDSGSVTVSKGNASATQKGDGTISGSMQKATTIGQAHALLNHQGSRTKMIMFVMQYNASSDKDPETLKNLVAALKQEDIKLYVHVNCDNTYNYFSRDALAFEAKGANGSYTEDFLINSGKNHEMTFSVSKLLDFATMTPSAFIIRAQHEDNKTAFTTTLPFPFEAFEKADAGSSGHYKISAHLQ